VDKDWSWYSERGKTLENIRGEQSSKCVEGRERSGIRLKKNRRIRSGEEQIMNGKIVSGGRKRISS